MTSSNPYRAYAYSSSAANKKGLITKTIAFPFIQQRPDTSVAVY